MATDSTISVYAVMALDLDSTASVNTNESPKGVADVHVYPAGSSSVYSYGSAEKNHSFSNVQIIENHGDGLNAQEVDGVGKELDWENASRTISITEVKEVNEQDGIIGALSKEPDWDNASRTVSISTVKLDKEKDGSDEALGKELEWDEVSNVLGMDKGQENIFSCEENSKFSPYDEIPETVQMDQMEEDVLSTSTLGMFSKASTVTGVKKVGHLMSKVASIGKSTGIQYDGERECCESKEGQSINEPMDKLQNGNFELSEELKADDTSNSAESSVQTGPSESGLKAFKRVASKIKYFRKPIKMMEESLNEEPSCGRDNSLIFGDDTAEIPDATVVDGMSVFEHSCVNDVHRDGNGEANDAPCVEEKSVSISSETTENEELATLQENNEAQEDLINDCSSEATPFMSPPSFELRQVNASLQLKAFSGVTMVKSKSKMNLFKSSDNDDGAVTAVATIRKNTISNDRFVSTNLPSLPLLIEEKAGEARFNMYAKWDSEVACANILRTVRRMEHLEENSNKSDTVEEGEGSQLRNVGRSSAVERNERDGVLSAISKAFSPELIDIQIGLMNDSREMIPLGVVTVIIPGEYQSLELDLPVVKDYSGRMFNKDKQRKSLLSSFREKTISKDYVAFSADKGTMYTIREGAFLRLKLTVEPSATPISRPRSPFAISANHKSNFRSGPINKAIQKRRKIERLLSQNKLSLYQRIQLYMEFRNPESKREFVNSMRNLKSQIEAESENDDDTPISSESNHLSVPSSSSSSSHNSTEHGQGDLQNAGFRCDGKQDKDLRRLHSKDSAGILSARSLTANTIISSAMPRNITPLPITADADPTWVGVGTPLPDTKYEPEELEGRRSPISHKTSGTGQFSSSLHSVFNTNHPQKSTARDMVMKLLSCEPTLFFHQKEIDTLKYYVNEIVDEAGQCFGREKDVDHEYIPDDGESTIQETLDGTKDDSTFATFESTSLNSYRPRHRSQAHRRYRRIEI